MIKAFFLLLILIFTVGCARTRVDIVMAEKHMSTFAAKMKASRDLTLFGEGGGMMDDIERICFYFISHQKCTLEEARSLVVVITEDFLKDINSDEKIRPYLHNYPFTNKNLRIGLVFEDQNNTYVSENYIAQALLMLGDISYSIRKPGSKGLDDFFEETYEDALNKVHPKSIE